MKRAIVVPILLVTITVNFAHGQTEQKLTASDQTHYDSFGQSVSVYGDVAVVGSLGVDRRQGAVYIFRNSGGGWSEEQKLSASDAQSGEYFGAEVAIYEDVLIVGAEQNRDLGPETGAAYIFRNVDGVWEEEQKLTASDAAERRRFGGRVAIFNDTAVVGAYIDAAYGHNSGSVYIFRYVDGVWREEQKLIPSSGMERAYFGISVAIYGNVVLVGASGNDDDGIRTGAVYVFRRTAGVWKQEAKLKASDSDPYDHFGNRVAIYGNVAVFGAREYFDNSGITRFGTGSAYVFRHSGGVWTEVQKLTASDAKAKAMFGYQVAIYGDVALVSALADDENGPYTGAVYIFRDNGEDWKQEMKLTASDANANASFGNSLAIFGKDLFVGARHDHEVGEYAGAAYAYLLEVGPNAERNLSSEIRLHGAYPNPSRSVANIHFSIPRPLNIALDFFNTLGKTVKQLNLGIKPAGEHDISFDATALPSGVYFYTLKAGDFTKTRKMVVVK